MRLRRLLLIAVVTLFAAGVSHSLTAAQAAPPSAPSVPQDELVKAWLETLQARAEIANTACQGLEAVRRYQTLLRDRTHDIEVRLPGYTVDPQRLTLVPKPSQK